jgi:hypothetical protein
MVHVHTIVNDFYVMCNKKTYILYQTHFFISGSKLTAIEIWLITCIFFISVAMMEYGFILALKTTKSGHLICARTIQIISNKKAWQIRDTTSNQISTNFSQDINKLLKTIDMACLGVSALGFLIFNIIYWAFYL